MKLSKSLNKFYTDEDYLRWAQDTASRYIQESKIEGYLYLSVDPIDFLTLSENQENWWSCQTLDGEQRAGNLSYMVDKVTVVAYLADKDKKYLKCLPEYMKWFSKKWRMLLHIDQLVWYNKQYPYSSPELLEEVYKIVNKLFFGTLLPPVEYGFRKIVDSAETKLTLEENFLYFGGRIFKSSDIFNVNNYIGFCDLIHSINYLPAASVPSDSLSSYYNEEYASAAEEEVKTKEVFSIKIGARPICPCCGCEVIERHDSYLCPLCIAERDADEDFFLQCYDCRHHIYGTDKIFWDEDKPLCKVCNNLRLKEQELLWQ